MKKQIWPVWLALGIGVAFDMWDGFWPPSPGYLIEQVFAIGLIAMIWREINSLRRHEAVLQGANRLQAIGQLTAGVAHDFNNLLCIVIGNLAIAKTRVAPPSVARNIDEALGAAELGAKLTEQLLSFARKQMLHPEPVDVNAALRSSLELVRQSVGVNVRVEFQLCERGCWALLDANELSLAILNLVVNARDAMPDGGTLTLATKGMVVRPGERVDDLPPGRYALLVVSDTGVGMSKGVMAHAIEPFFTTKEVGKGTGLGLSQVHGFVTQSGGTLRLISERGQGCRVEIWLPQCASGLKAATERA